MADYSDLGGSDQRDEAGNGGLQNPFESGNQPLTGNVRRSVRSNFGVGPERFGNFATGNQRKQNTKQMASVDEYVLNPVSSSSGVTTNPGEAGSGEIVRKASRASSKVSSRTFGSRSSSTIKTLQISKLQAEIAEAESEAATKTAELLANAEAAKLKARKAKLESQILECQDADSSDEERTKVINEDEESEDDGVFKDRDQGVHDYDPRKDSMNVYGSFWGIGSTAPEVTFPATPSNNTDSLKVAGSEAEKAFGGQSFRSMEVGAEESNLRIGGYFDKWLLPRDQFLQNATGVATENGKNDFTSHGRSVGNREFTDTSPCDFAPVAATSQTLSVLPTLDLAKQTTAKLTESLGLSTFQFQNIPIPLKFGTPNLLPPPLKPTAQTSHFCSAVPPTQISKPTMEPSAPQTVWNQDPSRTNANTYSMRQPCPPPQHRQPAPPSFQRPQVPPAPPPARPSVPPWNPDSRNYPEDDRLGRLVEIMTLQSQQNLIMGQNQRVALLRQSIPRDLPFFNGEPEEWANFHSTYQRSTEMCRFTNDENLARLQKCLKGKAREAVQSLMVTPVNVPRIMELLQFYFGRPDDIIAALIFKAENAVQVREERPETLIDFSSLVQNLVSTVVSFDRNDHLNNPTLLKKLLSKLPATFRMDWGRHYLTANRGDLQTFANWVFEMARVAQVSKVEFKLCESKVGKAKGGDRSQGSSSKKQEVVGTASEEKPQTVHESSDSKTPNKSTCAYCKLNEHQVSKCKQFLEDEVNKRWKRIIDLHMCFSCLKKGHSLKTCQNKRDCGKDGCKLPHHPLLHKAHKAKSDDPKKEDPANKPFDENREIKPEKREVVSLLKSPSLAYTVLLKIVPIRIKGPLGEKVINAFFDDGSTCTLVDSDLASTLGLQGTNDPLSMQWTHSIAHRDPQSQRVELEVASIQSEHYFKIQNARTMRKLDLPAQHVDIPACRRRWKHLAKFSSDYMDSSPKILIGQDNYSLIAPNKMIKGPPNAPIASRTKLGWVIHGKLPRNDCENSAEYSMAVISDEIDPTTNQMVKDYFTVESFGIKPGTCRMESAGELRAKKILEETTQRLDDRYETGLLWKNDLPQLPESRRVAEKRLRSLERKMDRDSNFAFLYTVQMNGFIEKGYARKLSTEEVKCESPLLWYLPHFPVVNPNKPNKMRLVFDAASRSGGISLNDALLAGPDYLTDLPGQLFNFRHYPIAVTGDIKEMFPQIKIRKEDQPAQRFLWRGDDRTDPPGEYVMSSMVFGAKSSPCSAQYVRDFNARQFMDKYPLSANSIIKKHYMDNYLDSFKSRENAKASVQQIFDIHKYGGFKMCSWLSNCSELMDWIPAHLQLEGEKNLQLAEGLPNERILGLRWNPNEDTLAFNLKFHRVDKAILDLQRAPSKREFLQILMSVFDPLGMASHITIRGKFLLQDIWRANLSWDAPLTESLMPQWETFRKSLNEVSEISLPRCYYGNPDSILQTQLHVFCDASEKGFAAVAYYRFTTESGFQTQFIMAKSRVAPLKFITIPRLELMAAVMGTRLAITIQNGHQFQLTSTTFWTDSQIVLFWLRQDARDFKTFVANRVGEIEESTKTEQWRWVPTEFNTADFATRDKIVDSELWFAGPRFLTLDEDQWPSEANDNISHNEDQLELKRKICTPVYMANELFQRFSSIVRLHRVMGWFIRYRENCKRSSQKQRFVKGPLKIAEYSAAERLCIRVSQRSSQVCGADDNPGKTIWKTLQKCVKYTDENDIVRLKGRLDKSPTVSLATKNPILLDPTHSYTQLLIADYHERSHHQGTNTVINDLRQRYWIPQVKRAVKRVVSQCKVCMLWRVKPEPPIMGELPAFRTTRYERPFEVTGLDFFGPLEVTVKRSRVKRWVALFTCLSVRAVHVEIAGSLSTDSAIMAVRRFIARRGTPQKIVSDNGSNFRGAAKELLESLKDLDVAKLEDFATSNGIAWSFIPPYAPHMGGCWERMVGSIKTALKTVLNTVAPQEEVLHTLLCEAEAIVNRHPLTDVPSDPDETEALTPSHFLILQSGLHSDPITVRERVQPPGVFTNNEFYHRKQWRIAQKLADNFWSRWVQEYLPVLNRREKWLKSGRKIAVGDVAIVADHNLPRNSWPKGIITEVHPGSDGEVRVVTLRTPIRSYKRPVTKICVLDLQPREGEISPSPRGGMSKPDAEGIANCKSHIPEDKARPEQIIPGGDLHENVAANDKIAENVTELTEDKGPRQIQTLNLHDDEKTLVHNFQPA